MGSGQHLSNFVRRYIFQIASFGCLVRDDRLDETYRRFFDTRAILLSRLIEVLETRLGVNLRPLVEGEPIIYNTTKYWPANTPPAGYFRADCEVTVLQHMTSRFLMWELQMNDDPCERAVIKLTRAALWMIRKEGLLPSIKYLLDLQRYGYVIRPSATAHAIIWILQTRRRVQSDEQISGFLLDFGALSSSDWTRLQFREFDVTDMPVMREPIDDMTYLIARAESDIQEVIDCRNLDEWVLGQAYLEESLTIIRQVLERFGYWDALAFASSTTRIEEIRADAGSHSLMRNLSKDFPHCASFDSALTVKEIFRAKFADWQERLIEERVLVPAALQEWFFRAHTSEPSADSFSPQWRLVSQALTPVHAFCNTSRVDFTFSRRIRFEPTEAEQFGESFLQSEHLWHDELKRALIMLTCIAQSESERENFVNGSTLKFIEAVRSFSSKGDALNFEKSKVDALEFDYQGLLAREGLSCGQLVELSYELLASASTAELRSLLPPAIIAFQRGEFDRAAALRKEVLDKYPYFSLGHLEEGIALDKQGWHDEAFEQVSSAVLLNPTDGSGWHSMAVILNHLGEARHALAAELMSALVSANDASN